MNRLKLERFECVEEQQSFVYAAKRFTIFFVTTNSKLQCFITILYDSNDEWNIECKSMRYEFISHTTKHT